MTTPFAICQTQILALNSRLINSEIELDDYHRNVEALLRGMDWQMRAQCESIAFSRHGGPAYADLRLS